ncbi:hypothetical protein C0J52_26054 [Blattella germanica]|nr:hypothetical protein C0J52_26054 [Blattella germanica]
MYNRIFGPFFFVTTTINSNLYMDMVQNFLFPQIEHIERQAIARIMPDVLVRVWAEVEFRLDVCCARSSVEQMIYERLAFIGYALNKIRIKHKASVQLSSEQKIDWIEEGEENERIIGSRGNRQGLLKITPEGTEKKTR